MKNNTVKCEYRFKFNDSNKSADVVLLDADGRIVCIFEVVHTHYTREHDRPEPWHEIKADEINAIPSDTEQIALTCIREVMREECAIKLKTQQIERQKHLEEERLQREQENEYRAQMLKQWEAQRRAREEEEYKRRIQRAKELEEERIQRQKEIEEARKQKGLADEMRRANEVILEKRKREVEMRDRELYKQCAQAIPRCAQCSVIAIWVGASAAIGRCIKCTRLIRDQIKSTLQPEPKAYGADLD